MEGAAVKQAEFVVKGAEPLVYAPVELSSSSYLTSWLNDFFLSITCLALPLLLSLPLKKLLPITRNLNLNSKVKLVFNSV
jgi:hypothetical protein